MHAEEEGGEHDAGGSREHDAPAAVAAGHAPGRSRGAAEADDGAEGHELYEPVEGVHAGEADDHGDAHDEGEAEGGVEEALGEDAVLGHGGEDAGGGTVAARDAGHDGGKGRDGGDDQARIPPVAQGAVEGGEGDDAAESGKGLEVVLPA